MSQRTEVDVRSGRHPGRCNVLARVPIFDEERCPFLDLSEVFGELYAEIEGMCAERLEALLQEGAVGRAGDEAHMWDWRDEGARVLDRPGLHEMSPELA